MVKLGTVIVEKLQIRERHGTVEILETNLQNGGIEGIHIGTVR